MFFTVVMPRFSIEFALMSLFADICDDTFVLIRLRVSFIDELSAVV
jgi:hypothetical protein